jgi:hypothetical protein
MNKPSTKTPAMRAGTPPAPEQENVGDLIRKHPVAFIAGGVVLGLVAGALLPRGTGRRLAKGAAAAAVAAGQAGLHLSQHARDTAEDLTREGRETIERNAAVAQRRAAELAGNARNTGSKLVEQAVELASRVRQ